MIQRQTPGCLGHPVHRRETDGAYKVRPQVSQSVAGVSPVEGTGVAHTAPPVPADDPNSTGKVYLIGAGPGDPGLMTIKGKTLLEHADVVVYDALVSPAILAMINPQAEKIDVGKRRGRHTKPQSETTQLLLEKAHHHPMVIRLKGGDPFIFGRGGEEMEDLMKAGVSVEIIPGITSGIAAPAYAGIPLTHRNYSSSVTFVTGHEAVEKYRPHVNWQAMAQGSETIVIYMGIHNLAHIVPQLLEGGLSLDTPIALIRWGTYANQQELIGTLETIIQQVEESQFTAPAIAVIGKVVNLHTIFDRCRPFVTEFRQEEAI